MAPSGCHFAILRYGLNSLYNFEEKQAIRTEPGSACCVINICINNGSLFVFPVKNNGNKGPIFDISLLVVIIRESIGSILFSVKSESRNGSNPLFFCFGLFCIISDTEKFNIFSRIIWFYENDEEYVCYIWFGKILHVIFK